MFSHPFRVRYSECDQQGVVFNGHYLFYYDQALLELFRSFGYAWDELPHCDIVVAESTLKYRASTTFDELLDVCMPVSHVGNTSLIIEPRFEVDGQLRVEGTVRHVFIDPDTFKPTPIPPELRDPLEGASQG
ncbi:acyl-CoA thioesterase [Sciscionella marina]|uniref:acyl-CoA thioesterase n=1 Tax=Sciscionella marina TaxID=508770 RepID=UPI0003645F79|nr:thioesterase family protein [Sciscionella marina]